MTLKTLPNDITGQGFKTDEGKKFKVLKGDYFPKTASGNSTKSTFLRCVGASGFRFVLWAARSGCYRGQRGYPAG